MVFERLFVLLSFPSIIRVKLDIVYLKYQYYVDVVQ